MNQLEILALPPKQASATADSTKAVLEEIALRNHLLRFEKIDSYGPGQPRYRLRIEAELPGHFHLSEAQEIIKATDLWRWGELDSLGRLGVLIESAIARTDEGGAV